MILHARCIGVHYSDFVTAPTQPQHNLKLTQLSWVWHEIGFAHSPHHHPIQTQLSLQGASNQPLKLPKQQHQQQKKNLKKFFSVKKFLAKKNFSLNNYPVKKICKKNCESDIILDQLFGIELGLSLAIWRHFLS